MKNIVFTVPVLAGLLVPIAVRAQGDNLFTECANKNGAAYEKARDQFVASKPGDRLLKDKMESKDWKERAAAVILQGWLDNTKEYRRLLDTPKFSNQNGEERYPWMQSLDKLATKHAPLLFELLLKETEPAVVGRDAAHGLALLAGEGYPLDVQILHGCLRDQNVPSASTRQNVAFLLKVLPAKSLKSDDVVATLQAEMAAKAPDALVAKSLLGAVAKSAERLSTKEKDALVKTVSGLKGLRELVGEVDFVHAVGDIGGDLAAQTAEEYLEKTGFSIEKHWALDALGRSGSTLAARSLVKYAKSDVANSLAAAAINGLGAIPANKDIVALLGEIPTDNKHSEENQLRAVNGLFEQFDKNTANAEIADAVFTQMLKLDQGELRPAVRRAVGNALEAAERKRKAKK